jgi:hypothetical protein
MYFMAVDQVVPKSVWFCSPSLFYLLVHSRCRGFLFSLDHTQTHTTVGRTPLDKGPAPENVNLQYCFFLADLILRVLLITSSTQNRA